MATRAILNTLVVKGVLKSSWEGLLNGDSGSALAAPNFPEKTVQVLGTFGVGGTIIIEGSNDGGTTWHTINDSRGEGNAASFTAANIVVLLENPGLIRPRVTAGDGDTDLDVHIASTSGIR